MMKLATALGLAGLIVLLPNAAEGADAAASTWRCTSGDFVRKIVLFNLSGPEAVATANSDRALACQVVYTKDGASEVLWQARNNADYCEPRVLALVEKLEASGFSCELSAEQTGRSDTGAAVTAAESYTDTMASEDEARPTVADNGRDALRVLLASYYEDDYLDAMVAAIPSAFTVHSDGHGVTAGLGGVLRVGPAKHYVQTMPDGSYVLVNTLLFENDDAQSYVNFGFLVRDKRYKLLGYATVRAVSGAKVQNADLTQVSLAVTAAADSTCEASRRSQTLRWAPTLAMHYAGDSEMAEAASDCGG